MPIKRGAIFFILPLFLLLLAASDPMGQNGNAGAVSGTVTDPTGAVIPGATVTLVNVVSGLSRDKSHIVSWQEARISGRRSG